MDRLNEYLLPLAEAPALWCVFDPAWYLAAHPQVRAALAAEGSAEPPAEAVRAHYLAHGQPAGLSPVIWFDEAWYRASNPDVAVAVAAGQSRSGFEQYCLEGCAGRSPHWLYDEALYRALNPDLTDEALGASGCFNRYDHYLRDGAFTGRPAHLLFDAATYTAAQAEDPSLARIGAYAHFLQGLWQGAPETATSPWFDPAWYRARYPEAAAAIAAGQYRGALHHYLTNPTPTAFDPLADFSEAHYLATNPDVAAEVAAGRLRNGYEHFLKNGAAEGRSPAPWIDLRAYLAATPEAAAAVESRAMPHGFAYLLLVALTSGLVLARGDGDAGPTRYETRYETGGETSSESAGGTMAVAARAQAMLPLRARGRLDFTCDGPPLLTAIVTLPPERARAVLALAALRAEVQGPVELLLLDAAGHGPGLAAMMPGTRLLPAGDPAATRNTAIAQAAAPLLLFLDAGCEPVPGSIQAGLRRMARDPSAGAVGGPAIGADGLLSQAGLIVAADASVAPYLAGASPQTAEAGFVRDADACASTLLLLRRDLLRALGGLAEQVPDGAAADADLCLGVWRSGYRVVFDPAMTVLHESSRTFASAPTAAFAARHRDYLAIRPPPQPGPRHAARSPRVPVERVLMLEETLPENPAAPATAAIAALIAQGADVTLYPLDGGPSDPALLPVFLPETVEIICGPGRAGLEGFRATRGAMFSRVAGQP
ncbi:MAG: hypothetical protein J0H91_07550 [Rhodospirillales bacterium]|nr:hypothetical protein [Rhodospirillales bacterium]